MMAAGKMSYFNFSFCFQHSTSKLQNQSDLLPQIKLHNGKKRKKKKVKEKMYSLSHLCMHWNQELPTALFVDELNLN